MKKEIWKPVRGYEGLYEISSRGRIKSMNYNNTGKEGVMSPTISQRGYYCLYIWKDKKKKRFNIHILVAMAFLDHVPNGLKGLIIDHIDNNKLNNFVENLQKTTVRVNVSKDRKGNCKHTGVWYDKSRNKYEARITVDGKRKYLGRHDTEDLAGKAYTDYLESHVIAD